MITEREFKNYEEVLYFTEPETITDKIIVENIYEIVERECINDISPNSDLQNEGVPQKRSEVYSVLFWGISSLVSTFLWLYFFIDRFLKPKLFRYFK